MPPDDLTIYNDPVSSVVRLPDSLADQLAVEAVRRGVSVDELSAEILRTGLSHSDLGPTSERRQLAFAAIGASGSARGAGQADELLAEGFGRD